MAHTDKWADKKVCVCVFLFKVKTYKDWEEPKLPLKTLLKIKVLLKRFETLFLKEMPKFVRTVSFLFIMLT